MILNIFHFGIPNKSLHLHTLDSLLFAFQGTDHKFFIHLDKNCSSIPHTGKSWPIFCSFLSLLFCTDWKTLNLAAEENFKRSCLVSSTWYLHRWKQKYHPSICSYQLYKWSCISRISLNCRKSILRFFKLQCNFFCPKPK